MQTVKIENINQTFSITELKALNVRTFGTVAMANDFIKKHSLIANVAVLPTYFGGSIVLDMGDNEFFVSF